MESFNQQIVATVESSTGEARLLNKCRVILDDITDGLAMPWGWKLEGKISRDRYGNQQMFLFLRDKDGNEHGTCEEGRYTANYPEGCGNSMYVSLNFKRTSPDIAGAKRYVTEAIEAVLASKGF
jgi:hypothetical protein